MLFLCSDHNLILQSHAQDINLILNWSFTSFGPFIFGSDQFEKRTFEAKIWFQLILLRLIKEAPECMTSYKAHLLIIFFAFFFELREQSYNLFIFFKN